MQINHTCLLSYLRWHFKYTVLSSLSESRRFSKEITFCLHLDTFSLITKNTAPTRPFPLALSLTRANHFNNHLPRCGQRIIHFRLGTPVRWRATRFALFSGNLGPADLPITCRSSFLSTRPSRNRTRHRATTNAVRRDIYHFRYDFRPISYSRQTSHEG